MYHKGGDGQPKGFGFGGFAIQPKRTGPETQMAQMGFGMMGPGRTPGYGSHIGKKRVKSEEEYFEDDEEEGALEYQPAPGSPGGDKGGAAANPDSDSDDPLDAFMADIEKEVKAQNPKAEENKQSKDKKGVRDDIDQEDDEESYYRYLEENPTAGLIGDEEELDVEYDADGNVILPETKKIHIDPLPPIDHSEIEYEAFNKNFYIEHPEIAALGYGEVQTLRNKLGIRVSGILAPKPVSSFAHFNFDDQLMKAVRKAGYTQPMPIQAQGVPIALSGRDIIGIAKTGSGKTAAFIWPLLVHIMDQRELQPGDGPVGLILAPTRELSQQIYQEAKKFGKVYNIKVVCAYGGGSLWEQCKACEEGAEVIVATPGRLIDLVKKKATNLRRVTYLVFDEADRMFDMGFEPQVRSIANHVRPNRQTLLFSATFRRRIERLARDILQDPLRVVQGDMGEANEDVTQIVKVVQPGPSKWQWLLSRLVSLTSVGSVLIFVTRKSNCIELANNLMKQDFQVGLLHGDMDQTERNAVITGFKKKEMPVLVATDVAARGLDIPHIKTVINFDVARDIDTHTHRIGRTGRAGEKGTAFTMVTAKDKEFAGHLVRNLEGANQDVPQELLDIAMQVPWFKKNRFKQGAAKRMNVGGKGLGFRERPGLGSSSSSGATASSSSSSSGNYEPTPAPAPAPRSGPQSDRVATMRQAFMAQFKSNFVTAEDTSWKETVETKVYVDPLTSQQQASQSDGSTERKRRRKQRWDI